jgi:DNA-binding transcriptional MerR regulator
LTMASTAKPQNLTAAERHARLVQAGREAGVSEESKDFERDFQRVARSKPTDRSMHNVIGAFSEDHTALLAGVSRHQLREWDRRGLLRPSYGALAHVPYGRVYSFRDLVSARVLGHLCNDHKVSLKQLVEAHRKLSQLSDAPWASTVLYVLGREVVVGMPGPSNARRWSPAKAFSISR